MELIYTTRNSDFEAGKHYRNPLYFDRIERADSVVIDGDFPAVRDAYKAAGVPVSIVGIESTRPDGAKPGEQVDAQGLEPIAETPRRRVRKKASE